jgi:hypothetical protein
VSCPAAIFAALHHVLALLFLTSLQIHEPIYPFYRKYYGEQRWSRPRRCFFCFASTPAPSRRNRLTHVSGNLHELCRLLARIRANYQVSELYETPGNAYVFMSLTCINVYLFF